MNVLHHPNPGTHFDRYLEEFNAVKNVVGKNAKVLSFGCSRGDECRSLANIFSGEIHGFEIDVAQQQQNIKDNSHANIVYLNELKTDEKYDAIFCMSVLLKHVHYGEKATYPFALFEQCIVDLDQMLSEGGVFCIVNSNYRITDTKLGANYDAVGKTVNPKYTPIVPLYKPNGEPINRADFPYSVFRKNKTQLRVTNP